ncbi:MAG: TIGR02677 family protein [Actinomycetota bacterium]|nr:TIGR02677 family protein [Actinomycetota bacterium]
MTAAPVDRLRLTALRYAVNEEAPHYIAVMRVFTDSTAGLLSDLSAREVADRLADDHGLELDVDVVDARLVYLVEHGNLARSPRETEARSIREYLTTRARYQLTQRGELVHRQVEELLGAADEVREVSTEMLGGILAGLRVLAGYDERALAGVDPDLLAGQVATVFAQFERLVTSTRQFYTHLGSVLSRYDLGREDFQAFKAALLDYLQRFVDEIARTVPQAAELVRDLEPRLPALLAHADTGARLLAVDGSRARRSRGLELDDWQGLNAWFLGGPGRRSDADEVRALATRAMRSLLVNLRRLATSADREVSRYADLLRLARWFDESPPEQAHALWAGAFGLYSCRHLAFVADPDGEPAPATSSWWRGPVADVPVMLRTSGARRVAGVTARREDFAASKARRVAEREAAESARLAALAELAKARGAGLELSLSEAARSALLELYARALSGAGGPLRRPATAAAALEDGEPLILTVTRTPGVRTLLRSPHGELMLVDLSLELS